MKGFESFKTLSRRVKAILIAFVFVFTAIGVLIPMQRAKAAPWTPNWIYLKKLSVENCYANCATYDNSYYQIIVGSESYAYVIVNETNFPDESFRNWILNNLIVTPVNIKDTSGSTPYEAYIIKKDDYETPTTAIIDNIRTLNISSNGISDTTGLQYFTSLTTLDLSDNDISEIDLSHNTALSNLNLSGNNLTSLDVSNNTALRILDCSSNQLTALDISSITDLWGLDASGNNISGVFNLSLIGNHRLYRDVSNNSITGFTGMSSWGTWGSTYAPLVLKAGNNNLTDISETPGGGGYFDFSDNDFSSVDIVLGENLSTLGGNYYNLKNTSPRSYTDNSGNYYTASDDEATTFESDSSVTSVQSWYLSSSSMPVYLCRIAGITPTYTLLDSDAYVSSMTNDGFVNLPILGKTSNTWNTVLTLRSDATKSYTSFCIDIGKKCRLNNGYWSSGEYATTPLVNKIIAAYKNGSLTYQEAQCLIWGAVAGYTSEDNMTTILTDIESTDVATKVSAVTNAVPVTVYFWTNVYGTADYQRLVSELPPTDTTEITIDDPSTWYYVTYDGNGKTEGTVPTDTNKYQESEGFIVKAGTGLKKGEAVFTGWNTQPDGNGADYAPGDVCYINSSDLTLYAKYTAPTVFHVTYNANGGVNPPVDPTDYNDSDTVTVLSQEAMTNGVKVFNGWNTQPDGNGVGYDAGDTFDITSDTTLYALWADGATVVYEAGDSESGSVPVDNNVYAEGDTITVLGNTGNLAKAGYFFDGWKETVSDITYYKNDTIDDEIYVTTPLRVYTFVPVWSQGYQVVYDANEATGGTVPVDSNYYRSGGTAVALGNSGYLVKRGYTFDGWNTKADGTGTPVEVSDTIYPSALDADEAVDHIVTLYAQWVANNYRIVYDGNGSDGGTVPVDNNTYSGTNTAVVLGNSGYLTKDALEFKRWNTRTDGMGASFAPSDAICLAAYDEDEDNSVTLYAVWGDNTPVFTVEVPAIVRLTWTDIDDTTGTFSNVYNIVCDASGLNDKTANVRLKNDNPVLTLNNGEDVAVTVSNIQLTRLDGEVTYQVTLQTGVLNTADYLGKEYFTDCIFEFEIV